MMKVGLAAFLAVALVFLSVGAFRSLMGFPSTDRSSERSICADATGHAVTRAELDAEIDAVLGGANCALTAQNLRAVLHDMNKVR